MMKKPMRECGYDWRRNVRIPLQIDVGLGDVIVSGPKELEFPTLLEFRAPKLKAYSKEKLSLRNSKRS